MTTVDIAVHPAAAVWPMLSEPDLRGLAADIAENGQLHPILVDKDGLILDGRNRLAACRIAGVEPKFETYDGDPVKLVLSAEQRRHQSTGQRAMGTAMILAAAGKRSNGRWVRGSVPVDTLGSQSNWAIVVSQAGLVLDHAPHIAADVIAGTVALDAAHKEALANREHAKLRDELPTDLRALVDAGDLDLDDALRRAKLPPDYQERVSAGELTIKEAETLAARDRQDHDDAVRRQASWITSFLAGWSCASNLRTNPWRDDVLAALDDFDRHRFLDIEKGFSHD